MIIGPKFKIAKRLGAPIFEKTQTAKFAVSAAKQGRVSKRKPGQMSDYKRQLIEKQKMRFTYGITEKQLRRYVDEALLKSEQPVLALYSRLEQRLDNVVYRLGLAKTRQFAPEQEQEQGRGAWRHMALGFAVFAARSSRREPSSVDRGNGAPAIPERTNSSLWRPAVPPASTW